MDEVLRRRLVGAAVLLAAAFAVASLLPEPGPGARGDSGRSVTYDLRTGAPLSAPSDEAPERVDAPPGARLQVDETLGDPAGAWYVQIGSFESQSNARSVLQKLYGLGLPTIIQSVAVGKKLWYRVRVGPYGSEAAGQQALATIRQQGYPLAKLVRPDSAPEGN
jgi:cell division septation protein DedD